MPERRLAATSMVTAVAWRHDIAGAHGTDAMGARLVLDVRVCGRVPEPVMAQPPRSGGRAPWLIAGRGWKSGRRCLPAV